MANDASMVTAGKPKVGGAIWRAPLGTVLPVTATEELDSDFKNLGYISEDGVENSNSPETDSQKAWGGDVVLNLQTEKKDEFKFSMIEATNIEVLKAVYGDDNVSGTLDTGITIKANAQEQKECAWVIDTVLKGKTLSRTVIPKASVTEVSEKVYKDDEAVAYGTTISATPDAQENTHYEYIVKG